MKKAIIWDLDGTMWDSSAQVYPAWNRYMQEHGLPQRFTRDDVRGYCGKTLEEIAAQVFPDADTAWRNEVIFGCCALENEPLKQYGGDLFDGLTEVLALLHQRYHLSVVSNCGLGYIEAFFQGNRTAQFFDDYENAARTGKGKADNIRLVMERNRIDKAIYVGDTMGDCRAAEQAGAAFVFAAYGYGEVPEAKWKIESLRELPALVERIFSED